MDNPPPGYWLEMHKILNDDTESEVTTLLKKYNKEVRRKLKCGKNVNKLTRNIG